MKVNMLIGISSLMFMPKSKCMHKFMLRHSSLFTTWCQIHLLATFRTRTPRPSNILCSDIRPTPVLFTSDFYPIRIKNIIYLYLSHFYTCLFFKNLYALGYQVLFFGFIGLSIDHWWPQLVIYDLEYFKFHFRTKLDKAEFEFMKNSNFLRNFHFIQKNLE